MKKALTETDKQLIALETVEWHNISGSSWENYPNMKNIVIAIAVTDSKQQESYLKECKQVNENELNKQSIKLFGETVNNPIEEVSSCPTMYYDAALD